MYHHMNWSLYCLPSPISLTSLSTFFTEIRGYHLHLSCLYIWFVGNMVVFCIFYIESRIGDEVCFSVFLFFFFFPCLMFRFSHLICSISTRGDEVHIFYIWVFRPMLISKIKKPTSQTEQYPQNPLHKFY